jgi:hypothetical protein
MVSPMGKPQEKYWLFLTFFNPEKGEVFPKEKLLRFLARNNRSCIMK